MTDASGKECPVRQRVRRLIAEASAGGDADPTRRLAAETIRLARLAASTHMIVSAQRTAGACREPDPQPAEARR